MKAFFIQQSFATIIKHAKNSNAGEILVFAQTDLFTSQQLELIRKTFEILGEKIGLSSKQVKNLLLEISPDKNHFYRGDCFFSKQPFFPTIHISEDLALAFLNCARKLPETLPQDLEEALLTKNEQILIEALKNHQISIFKLFENLSYNSEKSPSEALATFVHELGHYLFKCKYSFYLGRNFFSWFGYSVCVIDFLIRKKLQSCVFLATIFIGNKFLERREERFADQQILKDPTWILGHNQFFQRNIEAMALFQKIYLSAYKEKKELSLKIQRFILTFLSYSFSIFDPHLPDSQRILKDPLRRDTRPHSRQ